MRYVSFRIKNFKGIKDTTVQLETVAGASVFAFVGLNESGKTTILEAIHSFAPDEATSELLGGDEGLGVPIKERVPRHLFSEFTGDVSVTATLELTEDDKQKIKTQLKRDHEIELNPTTFPNKISLERHQRFKDGDFQHNFFTIRTEIEYKKKRQKTWKQMNVPIKTIVRDVIFQYAPKIAYFPTFVFNFPKTIYLTDRGGVVDKFYRRAFQDILDYDGRGQTIEKDIIRRVRNEKLQTSWSSFLPLWSTYDEKDKIQHVVDRAGAAVTRLVFGKWNKIFGEETGGKEVIITYSADEGEIIVNGVKTKTEQHDIFVKFQIKDGTRRYFVNDRSLGFRWFFSFMLFTQFRVARASSGSQPLLFLFDEPASNLHAAAQQKLIDSFPEIARNGHVLAYSTHSHYMIEPKWLEQTFIVSNRTDDPSESILDEISLDDESLDVTATSYRSFVNSHSNQTSYFQPILDRLEVAPSRFDLRTKSIVVEGKSDYFILRYAAEMLKVIDLPLIPGIGAGTFGALAALNVGWNLGCIFLLDGDPQGKKEKRRYTNDYGIRGTDLITLDEIVESAKVIEDIIDEQAAKTIMTSLNLTETPTKPQILRFFQEKLASEDIIDLGTKFRKSSKSVLDSLSKRLADNE
ncbi:AAA family ATPase [Thalassospira sp. MIT1370]|uniref:AAA family ATPase n=1 Tax=unclassified Thalassospira TaxID=2648997 RepID=UPI00399AB4A9